jgi:hypothetical protein
MITPVDCLKLLWIIVDIEDLNLSEICGEG